MGYKTHRAKRLVGSLQNTWLKFVKNAHLEINPNDSHGHKVAADILYKITSMDTRLLNPEFAFTYKVMKEWSYESYLKLNYINNYTHIYNLNKFHWVFIEKHIEYINHYIALDESMKGRDYEYEDELVIK